MPQEPQSPQQDQKPPTFEQASLAQPVSQAKQFKLPKPVQIKSGKKVPKWVILFLGELVVAAVITLVLIVIGIIDSPVFQKGKPASDKKVATASSSQKGGKSTCDIYTREGAASKATINKAKEGNREVTTKFKEGSEVRLRDGKFVSLCGEDLSQINNLLNISPSISIERAFSRSEEELAAEFKTAKQNYPDVADLNLFYRISLPEGTLLTAVDYLINKLNEFSTVEIAYPEPQLAPPP